MICEGPDQADREAWALLTQLAPCSIPSQSSPFSSRLISGASVRPQTGAVDARVTWTQHSNPQAEEIAVWFTRLLCVAQHTQKRTYTCEMSYTYVSMAWEWTMYTFFFFHHTESQGSLWYSGLLHIRWAVSWFVFWLNITISPESRTAVLHPQMLICSVKHDTSCYVHVNQLVINVLNAEPVARVVIVVELLHLNGWNWSGLN